MRRAIEHLALLDRQFETAEQMDRSAGVLIGFAQALDPDHRRARILAPLWAGLLAGNRWNQISHL